MKKREMTELRKALTEDEVLLRYAVSRTCWNGMERAGQTPPFVRFGRAKRYPIDVLDRWDAERLEAAGSRVVHNDNDNDNGLGH